MVTVIAVATCVGILAHQVCFVQGQEKHVKDSQASSEGSGIAFIAIRNEGKIGKKPESSRTVLKNYSTVAYRRDVNSDVRNLTCNDKDAERPNWETFLNYLLRLKTCSEVSYDSVSHLKKECAKIQTAPTDYHTIGYLRFCNFDKYVSLCEANNTYITKVRKVKAQKNAISYKESYSILMACSDVADFSQELKNRHFAEGVIPVVDHSEWNTTLVPFCPPFAIGVTRAKYLENPVSLYNRMPSAGQRFVIFSIILDSILAIAILLTNWLELAVAIRTKIMKNIPGYFKFSLAVADIIVGLFVIPFCIYTTYVFYIKTLIYRPLGQDILEHSCMNENAQNVFGFLIILTPIVSVYTLTFASVDRCLAITMPFEYSEGKYFNKRRCFLSIAMAWVIGVFTAAFPIFSLSGGSAFSLAAFNILLSYNKTSGIVYFVILSFPLLTVFTLNGKILMQISSFPKSSIASYKNKSSSLTLSYDASPFNSIGNCCDEKKDSKIKPSIVEKGTKIVLKNSAAHPGKRPHIRNITAEVEHRVACTLVVMIAGFTLALLPIMCVLIIDVALHRYGISLTDMKTENRLSAALYITTRILLSNSFWNCIIYSIRNSHFRCTLKAIFLCGRRRINERVRSCTL